MTENMIEIKVGKRDIISVPMPQADVESFLRDNVKDTPIGRALYIENKIIPVHNIRHITAYWVAS